MSPNNSFKNKVTNKKFVYKSHQPYLALNNPQELLCYKHLPTYRNYTFDALGQILPVDFLL